MARENETLVCGEVSSSSILIHEIASAWRCVGQRIRVDLAGSTPVLDVPQAEVVTDLVGQHARQLVAAVEPGGDDARVVGIGKRRSRRAESPAAHAGRQPGQFYAVHSIVTDTKGNIYTTETYRGQRVQKFIYKGLVPLSTLLKKHAVSGSLINP